MKTPKAIITVFVFVLQACANGAETAPTGKLDAQLATPPQCIPGTSVTCACPDGKAGAQICTPVGTFGTCSCAIATGGSNGAGGQLSTTPTGGVPSTGGLTYNQTGGITATSTGGAIAVAHDAGAVVDSVAKLDVFDEVVYELCVTRTSTGFCMDPAHSIWYNDAGQRIPIPDADMATVPWTCLSRWRCYSCTRPGSTTIVAPQVTCPDQFGHPMCICDAIVSEPGNI